MGVALRSNSSSESITASRTVLRALRQLRDQGLLEFRRGRGVRVVGTPERGSVLEKAVELVELGRRHGYRRKGIAPDQAEIPWTIVGNYLFHFSAWQVFFFTAMAIGYHRARGEAPGDTLTPLTPEPIRETTYRDAAVKPGVAYVYAVVAVDTAAKPNRSEYSNRVTEVVR